MMVRVMLLVSISLLLVQHALGHIELPDGYGYVEDLPALFGPQLTLEGISGLLIPVKYLEESRADEKGCRPVSLESITRLTRSTEPVPWIALVERGDCLFDEKVFAMQQSGASGVIVGDSDYGSLIRMGGSGMKSKLVNIPSVFISKWSYERLLEVLVLKDSEGRLKVKKFPIKLASDEVSLIPILILFSMMLLTMMTGLWRARLDSSDRLSNFPHFMNNDPAPPSVVKDIPTKVFDQQRLAENDPDICAICLDDFVDGVVLRKLPCKHEFHVECVDPWLLTRKKLCPICKADVCPNIRAASSLPFTLSSLWSNSDSDRETLLPQHYNHSNGNGQGRPFNQLLLDSSPISGIQGRIASPLPRTPASISPSSTSTVLYLRRTPIPSSSQSSESLNQLLNVTVVDMNDYEEAQLLSNSSRNSCSAPRNQ
jgi:E3 ubiquitin-protein ligase RNF13